MHEDSNSSKIVKIGAIQSQFGPFFENPKFGKNEHWYYGTLVLETKSMINKSLTFEMWAMKYEETLWTYGNVLIFDQTLNEQQILKRS